MKKSDDSYTLATEWPLPVHTEKTPLPTKKVTGSSSQGC